MNIKTIVTTGLSDVLAFVEKNASADESAVVSDFKDAVAKAEAAFTPVADALVVAAVDAFTAKYSLNAPFSQTEIAFIESYIAKLQALLPTA